MGAVQMLGVETATLFRKEVISSLFVMDEQLKNFADNVISQMTHQKLTTAQLAKKAAIAPKTLNNLLNGRHAPQFDVLAKIAEALDVALWQLWLPEFSADVARDAAFPMLIQTASKLTPTALRSVARIAEMELRAGRQSDPT